MTEDVSVVLWLVKDIYNLPKEPVTLEIKCFFKDIYKLFSFFRLDFKYSS